MQRLVILILASFALLLGIAKLAGIVVLLNTKPDSRDGLWYAKQTTYGVTFVGLGIAGFCRYRTPGRDSRHNTEEDSE